eukprot:scaffold123753_cov22-Prasinocladus_malaysianus.AAC.1
MKQALLVPAASTRPWNLYMAEGLCTTAPHQNGAIVQSKLSHAEWTRERPRTSKRPTLMHVQMGQKPVDPR